jgi:two-component system sensor histidine kinase/response regulator
VTKPIDADELWQAMLRCIPPRTGMQASAPGARSVPGDGVATAQQAGPALLDALRAITGLEVDTGLMRTLNKPDFYVSMLRKFVASQEDAVLRIRMHLTTADTDTAVLLAHTLKGLAGNLGAMRLSDSAELLETLLHQGADPAPLEQSLASTHTLLQQLVHALQQIPGFVQTQLRAPADALSPHERQLAQEVVQEITACLLDNNASALELWETHAGIVRPLFTQWAAIEAAISTFEFDTALELLSTTAA